MKRRTINTKITMTKQVGSYLNLIYVVIIWALSLMAFYFVTTHSYIVVAESHPAGTLGRFLFSLSSSLATIVALMFMYFLLTAGDRNKVRDLLRLKSSAIKGLTAAALIGFAILLAIFFLKPNVSEGKSERDPFLLMTLLHDQSPISKIALVLLLGGLLIVEPFAEEFVFRFYLLETIRKGLNIFWAVLLTSFSHAFITVGLTVSGIFFATLFAIILALLYLRSRSLLPPILLNMIITSGAYIAILTS